MKKFLYMAAALLMAVSCNWKDEMVEAEELGALSKSINVECTAGSTALQVYSDGDFSASLPSDAKWVAFESGRSFSGSGDTGITISYEMNRGIARSTVITLRRGRKTIQIPFTQKGILAAGIEFEDRNVTVEAAGKVCNVKIITLCKDSDLNFEVKYQGEQSGWIDAISKTNNYLSFEAIENSGTERRFASIKASSKSDPSFFDEVEICQLGAGASLQDISISDMKALATKDGDNLITGNYVIEGIVIGDNAEGNGAPNINLSPSLQDLTLSFRSAYIQMADGSTGVKLVFNNEADNTLRRYDKVRILLDSLTLVRHSSPAFYDLTGLTSAAILSSTAGNAFSVVEKHKKIGELTNDDINTWVTLDDCEIPIRKGPFFPIDLRHRYVINRFPMPIRDIQGNSMHLVTNLTADWQRDGEGMPEGSGSISGIIVHETFDNFEWDATKAMKLEQDGRMAEYITEIGEIGTYQIRPVRKSDIALAKNFSDGFSDMIMEIRYYNKDHDEIVKNSVSNTIYSTYPAVEHPTSTGAVKGVLEVYNGNSKASVGGYRDWTLLGPMNGNELADPSCGNGVYDYFGNSAHFSVSSPSTTRSSSYIADTNGSSWYCSGWSTNKCWRAAFSTEDLTAANFPLSVQFSMLQGLGRTVGAPRYWVAEYSFTGSSWTEFGSWTAPDFPIISNRKAWQSPGPRYVTLNLPNNTNLLGKAAIYVRLRPANDKAGAPNSYDGGTIESGGVNQMNYFAIRYNK